MSAHPAPIPPPALPPRRFALLSARTVLFLRALNPVSLVLGPIFQREVRVLGRKTGAYWARGLYAFGLLAFATLFYLGAAADAERLTGAARVQRFQSIAPTIAIALGWFQFVAAILIAPILTSSLICDEKRARSMSALATSPITSGHIICAGLAGRMIQMALLLLLAAPLLLALRAFGGLDPEFILGITAITSTTALLAGALGVWGSVHAKRPWAASTFAFTYMLVLCFGPLVLFAVSRSWATFYLAPIANIANHFSPFMAMLSLSTPEFRTVFGLDALWLTGSLANLALTALVCALASLQLRRVMIREAAESPTSLPGAAPARPSPSDPALPPQRPSLRRAFSSALLRARRSPPLRLAVLVLAVLLPAVGFLYGALACDERHLKRILFDEVIILAPAPVQNWFNQRDVGLAVPAVVMILLAQLVILGSAFLAPIRSASRIVADAPVLWREARLSAFSGSRISLYLALAAGVILGLVYAKGGLAEQGMTIAFTAIVSVILLLQACAGAGASIAAEVQSRTWHALLTTPLSPREILLGKVFGLIRRLWLLPAILAAHCSLAIIHGELSLLGPILAAAIIFSGLVFVACLGVAFSLFFRKPTRASVWTMFSCLALWLLAPILLAVFTEAFHALPSHQASQEALSVLIAPNPVVMSSIAMEATFTPGRQSAPTFLFDMPSGRIKTLGFLLYAGFGCAALLLASWALLRLAEAFFPRAAAADR